MDCLLSGQRQAREGAPWKSPPIFAPAQKPVRAPQPPDPLSAPHILSREATLEASLSGTMSSWPLGSHVHSGSRGGCSLWTLLAWVHSCSPPCARLHVQPRKLDTSSEGSVTISCWRNPASVLGASQASLRLSPLCGHRPVWPGSEETSQQGKGPANGRGLQACWAGSAAHETRPLCGNTLCLPQRQEPLWGSELGVGEGGLAPNSAAQVSPPAFLLHHSGPLSRRDGARPRNPVGC